MFNCLVFSVAHVGLQHAVEPLKYGFKIAIPWGNACLLCSEQSLGLWSREPRASCKYAEMLTKLLPACLHNKDGSYAVGVEKGWDAHFNLLGLLNLGKGACAGFIRAAICVLGSSPWVQCRTFYWRA